MINYDVKDIALQRKKTHGFEEYRLAMQPNSVIVSDAANNLSMVDTASFYAAAPIQLSASYAITSSKAISASYAPTVPSVSSSYAQTASFALNAGWQSPSSSWASQSLSSSYAITSSHVAADSVTVRGENNVTIRGIDGSVTILGNVDTTIAASNNNLGLSAGLNANLSATNGQITLTSYSNTNVNSAANIKLSAPDGDVSLTGSVKVNSGRIDLYNQYSGEFASIYTDPNNETETTDTIITSLGNMTLRTPSGSTLFADQTWFTGLTASINTRRILVEGDLDPMLIYCTQSALIITGSGGEITLGNGTVGCDGGFLAYNPSVPGVGFIDYYATQSRAAYFNSFGGIQSSVTTDVELARLSGVTGSVQSQLNSRIDLNKNTTQDVVDGWGIANAAGAGIQLGAGNNIYMDGTVYASSGTFSGSLSNSLVSISDEKVIISGSKLLYPSIVGDTEFLTTPFVFFDEDNAYADGYWSFTRYVSFYANLQLNGSSTISWVSSAAQLSSDSTFIYASNMSSSNFYGILRGTSSVATIAHGVSGSVTVPAEGAIYLGPIGMITGSTVLIADEDGLILASTIVARDNVTAPLFIGNLSGSAVSASYAPTRTVGLTTTRSFSAGVSGSISNTVNHEVHILNGVIISWDTIPF